MKSLNELAKLLDLGEIDEDNDLCNCGNMPAAYKAATRLIDEELLAHNCQHWSLAVLACSMEILQDRANSVEERDALDDTFENVVSPWLEARERKA